MSNRFFETSAVLACFSANACVQGKLLYVGDKTTRSRYEGDAWCWCTDQQLHSTWDRSHFRLCSLLGSAGHLGHVWFWVSLKSYWILKVLSLIFSLCLHPSAWDYFVLELTHCWVHSTHVTAAGAVGDGTGLCHKSVAGTRVSLLWRPFVAYMSYTLHGSLQGSSF